MKLKNFVMVMFADDTMVVPKESEVRVLITGWCDLACESIRFFFFGKLEPKKMDALANFLNYVVS